MAVLEQRAVGEDRVGTRVQGGPPRRAVVVLSDTQDPEPGRSRQPHGRDPVIGPGGEVHDGVCRPAGRRSGGQVAADGGRKGARGPDADRVRPERPELADEPGGPDEIVGEDEDAKDARRALVPRHGHWTVQVSPERSSLARSPGPCLAIASRICASTSSSWVGRGTFRITPIGTGNSGQ